MTTTLRLPAGRDLRGPEEKALRVRTLKAYLERKKALRQASICEKRDSVVLP